MREAFDNNKKEKKEKKDKKELKDDKIIIDNVTDLLKTPFSKLNNTKLSNFSGKYYEEIYQEALRVERGEINQQLQKIQQNNDFFDNNNNQINNTQNINQDDDFFENNSISNQNNNNNTFINNLNQNQNINNNNNIRINENINNNMRMNNNLNNDRMSEDSQSDLTLQKVTFEIVYPTVFGEEIGILGSGESLGNWKQDKVIKLKWNKGNIWKGSISINEYNLADFEFKFVLLNNNKISKWESGSNNIVNFNKIYQEVIKRRNGRFNKYNYEYLDDELVLKCKWS
jgi:hypothetical protein